MSKINKLYYHLHARLMSILTVGHSKHSDRCQGIVTDNYIYSYGTLHTYERELRHFVKWCFLNHSVSSLEHMSDYANDYLEYRISSGYSYFTVATDRAALMKLYGFPRGHLLKTPARHRKDIRRSRGSAVRDRNFSEKRNKDFVDFCKGTGLRRNELRNLTGDKLFRSGNNWHVVVSSGAKGGRYREVIIPAEDEYAETVVRMMRAAGTDRVFPKMPEADIHSFRADFATRRYKAIARPAEAIPREDSYFCRLDLKGVKLDKKALYEVSNMLGHNRINVIPANYIRKEELM